MSEFFANYGLMLLWVSVAVLALIVESLTADMVSVWFLPGAFVAMILSIWVDLFWLQLLIFLALSVTCLLLARAYFKKHPGKGSGEKLNADSVIGKQGIVTETVDNLRGTGAVKIGGLIWTARSSDGTIIDPETVVEITALSGVKVFCRASDPISAYHQSQH